MAKATKRVTESWWYILPSDRELPESEQSRFQLSPLTYAERARMYDQREVIRQSNGGDERTIESRMFSVLAELALTHLEDVENFPASEPLPWPKNGNRDAKQRYLDMLADADVLSIGTEIMVKSTLGDAEKNS
jgi:hypothetical protein